MAYFARINGPSGIRIAYLSEATAEDAQRAGEIQRGMRYWNHVFVPGDLTASAGNFDLFARQGSYIPFDVLPVSGQEIDARPLHHLQVHPNGVDLVAPPHRPAVQVHAHTAGMKVAPSTGAGVAASAANPCIVQSATSTAASVAGPASTKRKLPPKSRNSRVIIIR